MPMNPYGSLTAPFQRPSTTTANVENKYGQLDSAVDAFQGGMYTGLGGVANSMDAEAIKQWALQNAQENYQQAGQYTPTGPQRIEDVGGVGEFFGFAGDKIIENAPQMGATIAGTALGAAVGGVPGAIMGGAASAIPSHLGEAYGKQLEVGIDDPMAMYGATAVNTALEFAPAGAFVGALRRTATKQMGGGTLARAVGANTAAEAITEPVQGGVIEASVGNMPEFSLQTPEQKAYWSDRMNEAAAGGIVGGTMGGAGHVASYPGQALQQAGDLPGQMYDNTVNMVDNMRGVSPEEQQARAQQRTQEREQYGFMGQSMDPANIEKKAGILTQLQNKREQGLEFSPFEQEILMGLSVEDRRQVMGEANEIRDTSAESEVEFGANIDEDMRSMLDSVAYDMADGTISEEDQQTLNDMVVNEDISQEEYQYLEAMASEYARNKSTVLPDEVELSNETLQNIDTNAPDETRRNELETLAERLMTGELDSTELYKIGLLPDNEYEHVASAVNVMKNTMGMAQMTPYEFDEKRFPQHKQTIDTFEGSDLQFQQGVGEEGDFQDAPEAELISASNKHKGRKYLGTGQINTFNKKPWSAMRPQVYSDKTVGLRTGHTEAKAVEEEQNFQTEMDEYNKSGQRSYKELPLSEALEKETLRTYADKRKEGAEDTGVLYSELLAQRKQEAVDYILNNNSKSAFGKHMIAMNKAGDTDGILNMFRAIESEPLDSKDNQEIFDYEQRGKYERDLKASNDLSEDTASTERGFIPLNTTKKGKLQVLDLPRALTQRMQQLRDMGQTSLSKEEIYAHNSEGADITPELQTLRRDALTSLMSEYSDRLGGTLINDNDVLTAVGMGDMDKADRFNFLKEMRQVNTSGAKNVNRFVSQNRKQLEDLEKEEDIKNYVAGKVELELAASPNLTIEDGYIPLKTNARHTAKDKKTGEFKNNFDRSGDGFVLDMRNAVKNRRKQLHRADLPSSGRDALKSIMAEYQGQFGSNKAMTLEEVMEKTSAVMNWRQQRTDSGVLLEGKTVTGEKPEKLLAINETQKVNARDKELRTNMTNLRKEQAELNAKSQHPMLNGTMDPEFTPGQKAGWNSKGNTKQRNKIANDYLKNYIAMDKLQKVIDDKTGTLSAARDKAKALDTSDFDTIRTEIIDGINNNEYLANFGLEKPQFESDVEFEINSENNKYTDKEAELLSNLGMARTAIVNAEYTYADITKAFQTSMMDKEESKGRFDPGAMVQEIDDQQVGDAQQTTTEAQIGYILGKEGTTKKSFDKSLKKALANEAGTATEGAGMDDRSSMTVDEDAVMDALVGRARSEDAQIDNTRDAANAENKTKSTTYKRLMHSIEQRKEAIAINERRIEQAEQRNNRNTPLAVDNANKAITKFKEDIERAQIKINSLPEAERADIQATKATERLKKMEASRTKERKDKNITDPKDWKPTGKTGDVLGKIPELQDAYADKNTGAIVRNTAKFAGETIPLAYVFKPTYVQHTLLVHKAPGTNAWMVSLPGTDITLTANNKTKKEALTNAIKRINERGVKETNTLIKEARDSGKKSGEVSDLFAIPTEIQNKKFNVSQAVSLTPRGFNVSNTSTSDLVKSTQALANQMLKGTGIQARIVDGKEAEKVAERLGIDEYKVGMAYGSLHGFAENIPNKDGSYNVYINPAMQGTLREEILAHEIGHVTMYGSVMDSKTTAREAQAVLNQFNEWLNKYGKDDTLYRELVESKKSPEATLLYLKSGLGEYHMGVLGKETSAYMKDFDEWYADEAGKALLRKLKNQTSRGFVQKYFTKLVELLRKIFKKATSVEKFLLQLSEQTNPQYALSYAPMTGKLSTSQTKLNKEVSKQYNTSMLQIAKDFVLDKDWNLRNFKIPAFTELADLMHKQRGNKATDNSYWSAKLTHMAKYDEHVTSIMRGATKEQQRQIISELYNEKLSDTKVSLRTLRIRELFVDLREYMKDAGIEINARKNYFPEIADVEYVEKHEEQFKAMMARYPKHMKGIAEKWNTDVEKRNHHLNRITKPEELLKPEDVPQAIYENIVKTEGVFDEAAVGQQTPNVRFMNHRIISFLEGRDKFEWETNYLQSSVTDATAIYITQTVKRVEYDKRFGPLDKQEQDVYVAYLMDRGGRTSYSIEEKKKFRKAARLTSKFEWLLKRAQDQGATPKQMQKARTYLAAEMGTLGRHTAKWLNERLGIPMPPAHSPINQTLQSGISGLMSLANVWVLGMSTLTSLADPIGIAVRTGSLGQAFSSFKTGLGANFSKNRTELKILAEAVGSISDIATKEALAHGYNMAYMTPAVKRMNDWFFHFIGLEQWTQATRLMAVDAAQGFLKRHDLNNNTGNVHSKRFLKELGLQEGDIKYGVDGKVRVLSYEQYQDATQGEQRSDNRLKLAIAEFVDEAILRPNPSQRPAWASDPHFALAFHLKSFMYAFQKTILNPLVHEAKNGNYMPLLSVAMYIPAMMAVGLTKDMLKTLGDDDDDWTPTYKANWDIFDYMWDGAEKGGLFGIAQPIFDIKRDMRYGGSGIGAMYSPGLDPDTFTQLPVPFNYSYQNLFDD